MCQSFTDLTLHRQEEIAAEVAGWIRKDGDNRWWANRLRHFCDYLAETYASMDSADLVAHRADLSDTSAQARYEVADVEDWATITALIDIELADRERLGAAFDALGASMVAASIA